MEKKKVNDPSFNPLNKQTNTDRRVFTNEEEEEITNYILENIIKEGILFTNYDFKLLIMDAIK